MTQLFYSSDRKQYGNKKNFQKIIEEFIFLENVGITVIVNGKAEQVYFKLMLVVGDNLGLNSILGFEESFNATYFCRFCRVSKDETKTKCLQNSSMLRTTENYCDDSQNQEFGVKESSVFHEIPFFYYYYYIIIIINVTENRSGDLMHDLLEGICRYELAYILDDFINKKNYLR